MGKTALLREYAAVADEAGARVVRLEGRELAGTGTSGIRTVVDDLTANTASSGRGQPVLLVDGYEHLGAMAGVLRDELLPALPARSMTVIAGRHPPPPVWRTDPGWAEVLRVVSVRNLDPRAVERYLDIRGVPAARHGELASLAHGHPLTLSLVVDVLARDPDVDLTRLPAGLVSELLSRIVGTAPTPVHRRALEVAAVARPTTATLLERVASGGADHGCGGSAVAGDSASTTAPAPRARTG